MSSFNKMATLGTRGFFSRATGSFVLSAAGRTDTSGEAARREKTSAESALIYRTKWTLNPSGGHETVKLANSKV